MAQKKMPYQFVLKKAAGTGTNDLTTDPIRPGRLVAVQIAAMQNRTTKHTSTTLLKTINGMEYELSKWVTAAADEVNEHTTTIYLSETETLTARFEGCVAADVLVATFLGWESVITEAAPVTP